MYTGVWWEDLSKRRHLEDVGVEGRAILTLIFKKQDADVDWIDLGQGRKQWGREVSCTHDNEPSGSVKCGEFLD